MPSLSWTGLRKPHLSLFLAAAFTLAAAASLAMTGDGLLRAQFESAFADRSHPSKRVQHTAANHTITPVAASESEWLGDARNTPATLASWNDRAVAKGDFVTLSMRGIERRLKIVSLKELPSGSLPTASNTAMRPVLVTLQPTDDVNARPIHMLLEGLSQTAPIDTAAHHEL
ncbi:MAG: hypothetical protein K0U74_04770 [Alphaproteobacteria bacterium]|nr:hypothetical protein [Alphaproteobacteria bacterium]